MFYLQRGWGSRWSGAWIAGGALLLAYRSATAQEVVPGYFEQATDCARDPDYVAGSPCPNPATAGDLYLTAYFSVPPTVDQYDNLEEQATRASQILCDATDGMMRIRSIVWSTSEAVRSGADIWFYSDEPDGWVHGNSSLGLSSNGHISSSMSGLRGDVFAHELGHLLFAISDSYVRGTGYGPSINGPARTLPDGTKYSYWTDGDHGGNELYPGLLVVPEQSAERAHTIMQQSAPQACVGTNHSDSVLDVGVSPFQMDPIHSYLSEGYCWQTGESPLGLEDCSAWPGSICANVPPLMSEFSGRGVFDPITNLAGTGYSAAAACPPPKETRQIVVQADIGLQDTCASPPCTAFHEQGRLQSDTKALARAGILKVRDKSLDNATAWHDIPYTWIVQTSTTATLLVYHPDFPADFPVAVWDMTFGTHGRVETINGNPVDAFSENAGPTLAIGYGVRASFMTEDGDGTVNRYEVQSKALANGAASLQMVLDLTRLRLQVGGCVDGDKHLRCRPMLYGRYGTIQDDPATPEDETKITLRDQTIWDATGEDIPHHDLVESGQNWEQLCRISYNPQTQRFESPPETARQISSLLGDTGGDYEIDPTLIAEAQQAVKTEWQHIVDYMSTAHGLDMSARDPETTDLITGLPGPDALARCLEKPRNILWPSYAEFEAGLPDQIVLVLDRSGSMDQTTGAFTANKKRLDFVKAGARAFLDMHAGRADPPEVGVIYFNWGPEVQMLPATLSSANIDIIKSAHFRDSTDESPPQPVPPQPVGSTHIVAALEAAREMHEASPTPAAAKGIVLISDGEDTILGSEAAEAMVAELQLSYQLQTITTGFDANNLALAGAVDTLNGFELATPDPIDLPGAFFEAGAREYGQSLARHFRTAPDGEQPGGYWGVYDYHLIEVEPGAKELQLLFYAGRGTNPSHMDYVPTLAADASGSVNSEVSPAAIGVAGKWSPDFSISDPDAEDDWGEYPITVLDVHYRLVKIPNPQPGQWRIDIAQYEPRSAELAAFVNNPDISCSISADTARVAVGGPVVFSLSVSDGNTLGEGVDFSIEVTGPDDAPRQVDVFYNEALGGYLGYFQPTDFSGRGKYLAVATCDVDASVKAVPGEVAAGMEDLPAFQRPSRSFVREASAAFHLNLGEPAHIPTTGPRADDADLDGIPNADEPSGDFDGDGLDDIYDGDADNDDVPDGLDPDPHDKDVPTPQNCTAEPTSIACCDDIWGCSGATDWAVYAEGFLDLRNNTRVETPDGDPAPVANAGTNHTTLGVDATCGDIESIANIQLNERAHVEGHARTVGTISEQNSVVVDEGRLPGAAIELPSLSTFAIEFPPAGDDVSLEPDTAETLAPGSYGKLSIKSRSKLYLGAGVYYFEELNVNEPDAEIVTVTPSGAPTYIYVKNTFVHRGAFRDLDGAQDRLFVAYFGSTAAHIETPFLGTFVAPKATVYLKPLNGLGHTGAFFGKNVEVDAGTFVKHVPFVHSWVGPGVKMITTEPQANPTGVEEPDSFSFEPIGGSWTATLGVGTSTNASEGATSLEITECGYQVVSSPTFETDDLQGIGDQLAFDVYVPSAVENPYWVGTIEVRVKVDGQTHYLGNVNLTPLSRGSWSPVSVGVSSTALQAFSEGVSGQIELVVNTSVCQESILIDNLHWAGTITLGERYLGETESEGCAVGGDVGRTSCSGPWWLVAAVFVGLSRLVRRRV